MVQDKAHQLKPAWLHDGDVMRLLDVARAHGIALRFVGGCVRDELMGRVVSDIDVATSALPQEVSAAYRADGVRVIPTGVAHGTVSVVIGARSFEITTLRIDRACDGRHADVAFTDDWAQDAMRRDFTMNALMMDESGHVYDDVGGWQDVQHARVRFIGDPAARIEEDCLRILRYFRFCATHGSGALEEAALQACATYAQSVARLSVERVAREMCALLRAPAPLSALSAMHRCGALFYACAQQQADMPRLEQLLALEQQWHAAPCAMLRLAALFGGDACVVARTWRLSGKQQRFFSAMNAVALMQDAKQVRAQVYYHGRDATRAALFMQQMMCALPDTVLYDEVQHFHPPTFPVDGAMLMSAGVASGKHMGELLRTMKAQWVRADFQLSARQLMQEAGL